MLTWLQRNRRSASASWAAGSDAGPSSTDCSLARGGSTLGGRRRGRVSRHQLMPHADPSSQDGQGGIRRTRGWTDTISAPCFHSPLRPVVWHAPSLVVPRDVHFRERCFSPRVSSRCPKNIRGALPRSLISLIEMDNVEITSVRRRGSCAATANCEIHFGRGFSNEMRSYLDE